MKKKLLFAAYSLEIGGIEKALVTLINYLAERDFDITLVLEKKQGPFLDEINKKISIIEYTPSYNKNKILAKCKNAINRANFIAKYKNKFDFSVSYATYSLSSSFIARTASKNSALWVHNNYFAFFDYDEEKYVNFFNSLNIKSFKNIIFVSEESKNKFKKSFEDYNGNLSVCNNLINYDELMVKSKEEIGWKEKITFLNIGRHDEKQKRLSMLINAAKKLKDDGYSFNIVLVGAGSDTKKYMKQVSDLNLEDTVFFEGAKKNPYPYYKLADSVILTSEFEGYPVVYLEALVFGKTIITTNVSDSEKDIKDKYGLVCSKDVNDIYQKMKLFLDNGFEIKEKFDAEKFNNSIINKIEKMINN